MRYILAMLFLSLSAGAAYAVDAAKSSQLEEVVVTGTREAEPLKEKPQTTGIIKQKEIQRYKTFSPFRHNEPHSRRMG